MKDYTETETWKAWRDSVLSRFEPNRAETKPLLSLLLAAQSPTNLENLATGSYLSVVCKPSVELIRALKRVWMVMHQNDERWVVMIASLEALGLGIGFATFYWEQLTLGKPKVVIGTAFAQGENSGFDRISFDDEIKMPVRNHNESCRGTIALSGEADFLSRVEVKFYYSKGRILALMTFDIRLFSDVNARAFIEMMPPAFSVCYFIFRGASKNIHPAIGYWIPITDEERERFLEIGHLVFENRRDHNVYAKEDFLDLMKSKLREIGIPFAETIVVR